MQVSAFQYKHVTLLLVRAPVAGPSPPETGSTLGAMAEAGRKKASKLSRDFGQRLRALREQRFLSQRELAEGIKIEVAQISRYERGLYMPNAETLVELARFLRVGVSALLLGQDEAPAGSGEPPVQDISLLERFRELEKLDRKDREVVIALIDAWVGSRQHEQIVSRRLKRSA